MAEMQVGRDMDAAVAKALGQLVIPMRRAFADNEDEWFVAGSDGIYTQVILPHYSTSDADALAALDAVLAKQLDLEIQISMTRTRLRGDQWACYFFYARVLGCASSGNGATRAESICRAILALTEAANAT